MAINDVLKELKAGKYKPLYLLHGEEPYYIDELLNHMEHNVLAEHEKGFNQTILYGKDSDFQLILNVSKRYPMMSNYQLVVVKEAQDLKWTKEESGKNADFVLQYFENPMPSTILVLAYKYGKFDKRKKIYKAIQKNGVIFQSDPIYENQIGSWVEKFLSERGASIEPRAGALIAEFLGTDLSKIANELEKLLLNLPAHGSINVDDVQRNIGISKDYNVFELQTALARKDVLKCNRIVNYFGANPKINPMVMVMAGLNNYFSKVLRYHYLSDKRNAAKELGINPYFVKDYELAARNFSAEKVFQTVSLLREYDMKSKGLGSTGNMQDGELMKELIFKILH